MIINLKQTEIEAALKGYVAQQGISLTGKQVEISFTAGRKESGVSAELTIEEDVSIPTYPQNVAVIRSIKEEPKTQPEEVQEAIAEAAAEETQPEPVKTTSLFG